MIIKNDKDNEYDEFCCIVVNDELSIIKESENESVSGTESAVKSRRESQINLKTLLSGESDTKLFMKNDGAIKSEKNEKKEDEFLKPIDITIFNKSRKNNYFFDFEDEVNKEYGLFPII